MKKLLRSLSMSITISDSIRVLLLSALDLLYVCSFPIMLYFLALFITNDNFYVAAVVIACILTICAGLLIRTFKIWIVSLPVQFVLCVTLMYGAHLTGMSVGGNLTIAFCAGLAGILLLIQVPGIFVGLLIRKRRNRKQAPPAA